MFCIIFALDKQMVSMQFTPQNINIKGGRTGASPAFQLHLMMLFVCQRPAPFIYYDKQTAGQYYCQGKSTHS